jgi:hypothetical protein
MRVIQRTADTLVVEDSPDILLGAILAALGSIGILVAWTKGPSWLFVLVCAVFLLIGLKFLLFARTTTHRFDRWRGLITIDSKGLWQSKRRERELPFDSIADVVLEKKQVRGGAAGLRYWVEYVTTNGERIAWSDFTSSKDDKVECIQVVRAFLGIANSAGASELIGRSRA